jgi:hypothetical protein
MSAGLLISYFDASSKALDYQSKNPGARGVRVANLTRKASLTGSLKDRSEARSSRPYFRPPRRPVKSASMVTAFYNAAAMQADM